MRQVEIDDRHFLFDAAVENRELAEEHQQPVAEVVEDRLVDLRIGRAQPLAQREDDLAGELGSSRRGGRGTARAE